jgi:predicted  nucleic acid-binding Zn-ribbon protein
MSTEAAVEAKTEAEVKPVEAPVVEAEAKPETAIPEVKVAEQVDVAQAALTVERDGLKLEVTKLSESAQSLTSERDGLKVERDGLAAKLTAAGVELTALKADRDEACRKLAAIMAGAPPVSATPAPEIPVESAWKKAQKAAKRG